MSVPSFDPAALFRSVWRTTLDEPAGHPLGLLHKGLIEMPDPSARRVINSIGVTTDREMRAVSNEEVEWFAMRVDLD